MKKIITVTLSFVILSLSKGLTAQMTFHWRQYSGRIQTNIVNPDSANTLVTGLTLEGQYGYELTVSNAFGEDKDSCIITVLRDRTLSIINDTSYHIERPEIKNLEIKMITRASDIFLQIKSPRQQEIKCIIYDIVGRPIAQIVMQVKHGTNYISIPKPRIQGVYILTFATYFNYITQKIYF